MFRGLRLFLPFAGLSFGAAIRDKGTWKDLSPIPHAPRQEHGVVALSSTKLAIVGGIIPNSQGTFDTVPTVQVYDVPSDSWATVASAPIGVNHPNVAAVSGKIYLLGGLKPAPDGTWRAVAESWVYDPATDAWTPLEPVPADVKRGSAAMGVHNEMIYLAGGMRVLDPSGETGEQDTVDFVSAFNTTSRSWVDVPSAAAKIPEGRDHSAYSVVGHRFYVLGGRNRGQRNVKDTVFILDLDDMKAGWRTSAGRMPTARGGVVSGTVDGKVYVFGGEGNPASGSDGVFDQSEVFDTRTETWRKLDPMKVPRHGGGAAAVGHGIYVPGGGTKEGGNPVDIVNAYFPARCG